MSCNGCRVLRKGCSEGCALRPCLQWIESPESQGFATLFVAKFFGRAGLMEFISAVPENERTALFQSLLYEACGRTVNPVYGAVGLLWSGKWHICQEAVETVLSGGNLHNMKITNHGKPIAAINSATAASANNFNLISKTTTKLDQAHAQQQHALINNMRSSSSQGTLFNGKSSAMFTTSPNFIVKPDQILAISSSSTTKPMNFAIDAPFSNANKRLKVQQSQEDVIMNHGSNNICNNVNIHATQTISRQPSMLNGSSSPSSHSNGNSCLSLYRRVPTNSYSIINTCGLNITTSTNSNVLTHTKLGSNNSRDQSITIVSSSLGQHDNNVVNKIPLHGENQKVELDLKLKSDHQTRSHDLLMLNSRVSSPCSVSEGSIVTTMESPINPASSCHQLSLSLNSSRSSSDIKLLNLLV